MIYESSNQQPAVNVYPNGNGGNGGSWGGDAFGGGAIFWVIILFLFVIMLGWGNNNNGNNANANGSNVVYMPYGMMGGMGGMVTPNYIQQSFDQAAVMNGLNTIQGSTNNLAMGLQNCCCENRAAVADVKYTVATEACADRAAVNDALQAVTVQGNANTQRILDKICQVEMDGIKQNYENRIFTLNNQYQAVLSENQALRFNISQDNQTATIQAGQRALANEVEQYVVPTARPAYIVQNPNGCSSYPFPGTRCCGR